jgi:UDP-N-acetylmuramate--alanine ligase
MEKSSVIHETKIVLEPGTHVHLVGIGGFGMSAIARVLVGQGYRVSGSDRQPNEITAGLQELGVVIHEGHSAENIMGADIVLISSAIPDDNPEIVFAKKQGLPVVKRYDFLSALTAGTRTIAIAGTHGKTTTTSIIAKIMLEADMDPSIIVGGILPDIGGNGRAGSGGYFLIEADEYDHMFLGLNPSISAVTNIEFDHPDIFPTKESYQRAFQEYVFRHKKGSLIVVNADDQIAQELVSINAGPGVRIETYGLKSGYWRGLEVRPNQVGGSDFVVQKDGIDLGVARLRIPGSHNVQNALAAIAVTSSLGLDLHEIHQALSYFGGVNRRFEIKGEVGSVMVIDDYAHHPTEIRATLKAARERFPGRAIWAIWQPHTYSRIKYLLSEFETCFAEADHVVALDVFKSRERNDLNVRGEEIASAISHPNISYQESIDSAAEFILDRVIPGDVLITLTAGDGNIVGVKVLEGLRRRLLNGNNAVR